MLCTLYQGISSAIICPLAEKYYGISPYALCGGNPVMYIDPDGRSPIYDTDGNFLGTDDNGLQENYIVMSSENFKQGMNPDDAISLNTTPNDNDAYEQIMSHYQNLPNRPDWDGYLTLNEANEWYQTGNGEPLFVDLRKIDLSGVVSLGEKYVGQVKTLNLLIGSYSLNDGLVYGQVTLKRYSDHSVRAFADKYDFEMHSWKNPMNWGRNIETLIGRSVAGKGTGYEINIYSSKTLQPILPWIK